MRKGIVFLFVIGLMFSCGSVSKSSTKEEEKKVQDQKKSNSNQKELETM